MSKTLGLRKELLAHEHRAPLSPAQVGSLCRSDFPVRVQPSSQRIFTDADYRDVGATLDEQLEGCDLILGLKELPPEHLRSGVVHAFFSHTIKGQPRNMPMLEHLIQHGCTLIDYERIVDARGNRMVFFGRYAGLAGMLDTLWALGQRLALEGVPSAFESLRPAHAYNSIDEALVAVREAGQALGTRRLPEPLCPLVIGVAGTGNAARGALRILEELGAQPLPPAELRHPPRQHAVYQVNFRPREMVEPRLGFCDPNTFDRQLYYARPGRYRGIFERYLPYLNVLVNCIYWDERYPRLVTVEGLRALFDDPRPTRLKVIGDISCDVRGSIEATVRTTTPQNPAYVYEVETGAARDGFAGQGPVIVAIYNLPSEFPREASEAFGQALLPFVGPTLAADTRTAFEHCQLPEPIRRATIVYRGELTPDYRYLAQYL